MTAPRFRQRYGVSVPATSANLGPGFDSFGVALDLRNDFFAELDDEWSVEIDGEGAGVLRTDSANQVAVAMGTLFAAEGHPDLRARIHCINRVPTGNGLGSSSTAIVGGLLLGREAPVAGNAGVLLTRVIRVKRGIERPFVVVDAAMNDLARPAMYGAWHDIVAVEPCGAGMSAHIFGPICETGDTFATDRECDRLEAGDLAVFRTAGAYGATMASSYNSRGFVAEVLVDGDRFAVVADRIAPAAIMDAERVPEWLG